MASSKKLINRHSLARKDRHDKGLSTVISTIIITAALLIILVIASFVATSILDLQMTDSEFQQAQSNMELLDSTIQDVSLRPGAGGYVQFNEREGGIGIATTTDSLSITIQDSSHQLTFNNLLQLIYSGGPSASAAVDPSTGYTSLRGAPNSTYVSLTEGLGFLRLEQDNGAKIKLDYDRVRIVSTGLIDDQGTNLVQITFIHLVRGDINATSGTVNVMVQNSNTILNPPLSFPTSSISVTVQHTTNLAQSSQTWPPPEWTAPFGTTQTLVLFSEIQVTVSLR
jgi:hypothetical protein